MTPGRLQKLRRLLKQDPNDPFMNYAVGLEYISKRKYKLGAQKFQKIIEKNQTFVPAYHQLGMLLLRLRKKHEAIEILQKGIRIAGETGELSERAEMEDLLFDLRRPYRLLIEDKYFR